MRAVRVDEPGGPDRLRHVRMPVPDPGPGELRIRVAYAAANWSDIQKRQGIYPDPVEYPIVLGAEVSGVVDAVGPGVPGRWLGRRVAALAGPRLRGGYAEAIAVPLDLVLRVPDGVAESMAAGIPLAALTAHHLIDTAHRVRSGEIVLVHAIAGSVGLSVVQLAVARGAIVLGTVGRADKQALPLRLGARLVIDRSRDDFVEAALDFTGGRGVDYIIDSLGGEILPRSFDALRRYGHLVNIGEASGEPDFPVRKKLYERSTAMSGFEVLHARADRATWERGRRTVERALAAGRLVMPIHRIHPFADVARMHEELESRTTAGKLLLEVHGAGG